VSLVVAGVLTALLPSITLLGQSVPPRPSSPTPPQSVSLIDLDHFLIARLKTGNWDAVRFCLTDPGAAVTDQSEIFDPGDVGVLSRLLSHVVLTESRSR